MLGTGLGQLFEIKPGCPGDLRSQMNSSSGRFPVELDLNSGTLQGSKVHTGPLQFLAALTIIQLTLPFPVLPPTC